MFTSPDRYGSHRVIDPPGALPQSARKLDNTPVAARNEVLCQVDFVNLDAASYRQIDESCDGDPARIAAHVLATIAERGKQHNPVTGSGGMFVGSILEVGKDLTSIVGLTPGTAIASLVSLTLTPLVIEEIFEVDRIHGRLRVNGKAILFESGHFAVLPPDMPVEAAVALFDVAGAPAQVARITFPGARVAIVGADGKSGTLSCAAARQRVGNDGRVIGIVPDTSAASAQTLLDLGLVDKLVEADARDALGMLHAFEAVLPELADVTVNCVNVAGTELGSILCTRDRGTVYFFSMATSFSAAALGAEGVGRDVNLLMGNGYASGHADFAIDILSAFPGLRENFIARYGPTSHHTGAMADT